MREAAPFTILVLKTLESILEVVILSAGGYVLAKNRVLSKESQKTISNLNMNLFTPCLVASKLAGSLSRDQLGDLWLLPIAFVLLTAVSYATGLLAAKVMRLPSKQTRFVIGCTVFQNSNSLPLALVTALAYSLDGLWWDQRTNDTDEAVASRGILYLLVFSQLGLTIRWSYGYNFLFARHRPGDMTENVSIASSDEEVESAFPPYQDEVDHSASELDHDDAHKPPTTAHHILGTHDVAVNTPDDARIETPSDSDPQRHISTIRKFGSAVARTIVTIHNFLNPPLWAMIIALVVACVPALQEFFFRKGSFQYNSITTAVTKAGDCAVPLILVVLGANLAQTKGDSGEALPYSNRTVWTAIVSRMILVPIILLPILTVLARFAPVSIVDDPIFIVVFFLLIGSPTAIQVASICQLNDVFEQEITKICWYSYAILTVPTTLILVVLSLACVELNKAGPWLLSSI